MYGGGKMEIETKRGRIFIGDIGKIYSMQEEIHEEYRNYNLYLSWLTKKHDYEETYYDLTDKTLFFDNKEQVKKAYDKIKEQIEKKEK